MKHFSLKTLIVAALLWCGALPASAALAVTHKGQAVIGSGTTVSVTGLTIPAGDLIVVGCGGRIANNADTITISDTAGDTFTYYEFPAAGSNSARACVAFTKTAGLSGGSVTATASAANVLILGISVEDVTGFDTTTIEDTAARNTASSVSANPSITSGTPAATGDLFYSSFLVGNVTYTEDATWTNTAVNQGNTNAKFNTGYFISSGNGTVTRTGTAASSNWKGIVIGIRAGAAGGSSTGSGLSLMGVTN